jgi:hypothetical protein
MAKTSRLNAPLAPALNEDSVLLEPQSLLSLEERNALKLIFATPAFVKAWRNAKVSAPSPMIPVSTLNAKRGEKAANNRLHEMRGWKLFEAALLRQTLDPVLRPQRAPEEYPDSGL